MRNKFRYSDLPLAERMLLEKHLTIKEHRDHAAMIALQIACVALNDTEKMGFDRLVRFAKRQQELTAQYYDGDIDVSEAHLHRRLEDLGFYISESGHIVAVENPDGTVIKVKDADKKGVKYKGLEGRKNG